LYIKTIVKEIKQWLMEKDENTETLKIDGMVRNAKLQQKI
jgi:hypothetical protein